LKELRLEQFLATVDQGVDFDDHVLVSDQRKNFSEDNALEASTDTFVVPIEIDSK
jgi:hypothetical protein